MLNDLHLLSNREQQIAEKVVQGLSNKLIANELFISERTVKFHCANIYRKLALRNRHALIAHYYKAISNRDFGPFNLGGTAVAEPIPPNQRLNG